MSEDHFRISKGHDQREERSGGILDRNRLYFDSNEGSLASLHQIQPRNTRFGKELVKVGRGRVKVSACGKSPRDRIRGKGSAYFLLILQQRILSPPYLPPPETKNT